MKKKKRIITESERQVDLDKRQQAIIESFGKTLGKLNEYGGSKIAPINEYDPAGGLKAGMTVKFNVPGELNDNPEVTAVGKIRGFDSTTFEDYVMISFEGGEVSVPVGEVQPMETGINEYGDDDYPAGAKNDPRAPYNQITPEYNGEWEVQDADGDIDDISFTCSVDNGGNNAWFNVFLYDLVGSDPTKMEIARAYAQNPFPNESYIDDMIQDYWDDGRAEIEMDEYDGGYDDYDTDEINEMDPVGEEMSEERVYINQNLAANFDMPYQNDGEKTVINANTLRDSNPEWDSAHQEIFAKYSGKDLLLGGAGYGWWKILKAVGGMNEVDPVGDGFGAEYEQDNTLEFINVETDDFEYNGENGDYNYPEYASASLIFVYADINEETVSYRVNILVDCGTEDAVDNSTNREFQYIACGWDGDIESVFDENNRPVDEPILKLIKNTIERKPDIKYQFTEYWEDIAEQYWENNSDY